MQLIKLHMIIPGLLLLFLSVLPAQAQYKFMFLNSNPDKMVLPDSMVQKHQKYHMKNMEKLATEGFLLVAGPFYTGGGIFIFDPAQGDLYENLKADSAIINNRFLLDIYDYEPILGGICAPGENYDMVTYQFVRLFPFSGSRVLQIPAISKEELDELSKELKLVTYARFSDGGGEILIYNQEERSDLIGRLRSVTDKTYRAEEKKLYIASGSFCEN